MRIPVPFKSKANTTFTICWYSDIASHVFGYISCFLKLFMCFYPSELNRNFVGDNASIVFYKTTKQTSQRYFKNKTVSSWFPTSFYVTSPELEVRHTSVDSVILFGERMSSYFDEHGCEPLADGETPNHALHLAR